MTSIRSAIKRQKQKKYFFLKFEISQEKLKMDSNSLELGVKVQKLTEREINEALSSTKIRDPQFIKLSPKMGLQNCEKFQSEKSRRSEESKTFVKRKKIGKNSAFKNSSDFPCDLCGKILKDKTSLDHHKMALHEISKPHVCESCGLSFVRKGKLNEHVKIVHLKQKKYKCIPCGKEYGWPMGLKYHNDTVHKNPEIKQKKPISKADENFSDFEENSEELQSLDDFSLDTQTDPLCDDQTDHLIENDSGVIFYSIFF